MKISLITACFNSEATIRTAIDSVLSQKGVDVEYIVVDGGSSDGTVEIIKEYAEKTLNSQLLTPNFTFRWLSESDQGMYDAINKGIKMATGDIVGILNADDVLASDDTLAHIAGLFSRVEHVERVEYSFMISTVPSVDPPSTMIYSISTPFCARTLSIAVDNVAALLKHTVIKVTFMIKWRCF